MDYFYAAQLRQYRQQFIRAFSNFYVKTGVGGPDNTIETIRVPCRYGDPTRLAQTILQGNSENKILSTPFISCTVSGLTLDAKRRHDPQLVQSAIINERKYDEENQQYTNELGNRYIIDRYMPVPYSMTMQVDIWTNNLDMKEQLIEQILVLYNPAINFQTSVNPIDWTVLSYFEMTEDITWSSRTIGASGTDNPIDIFTMRFKVPIWINPPAKVKKQTLIQQIITSVVEGDISPGAMEWNEYNLLARTITTPGDCHLKVSQISGYDYSLQLCGPTGSPVDTEKEPTVTFSRENLNPESGMSFLWNDIVCTINDTSLNGILNSIRSAITNTQLNCQLYNGNSIQFINNDAGDNVFKDIVPGTLDRFGIQNATYPGGNLAWWRLLNLYGPIKTFDLYGSNASQIRLKTVDNIELTNTDIIGWLDFDPIDQNRLIWHGEPESFPSSTMSAITAIVDPTTSGPNINLSPAIIGQRYLLTKNISNESVAWGSINANANDIIQFDGINWKVSWTPSLTPEITQYVKNNKTSQILRFQNNFWSYIINEKYAQGYWTIAI